MGWNLRRKEAFPQCLGRSIIERERELKVNVSKADTTHIDWEGGAERGRTAQKVLEQVVFWHW